MGAKTVVHHANSTFQLLQDDGSFEASGDRATEYAMGKLGEIIPAGVCRVIPQMLISAGTSTCIPAGSERLPRTT